MNKKEENNRKISLLIKEHAGELTARERDANKGTYGRLLIIAGSSGMAGAAFLCGLAAYRMGTGMVKYFGTEDNRVILQTLLPEAMYESWEYTVRPQAGDGASAEHIDIDRLRECLKWADYAVIGPGLSKDNAAREAVGLIFRPDILEGLREKKLFVLDADALNIIADENPELEKLGFGKDGASYASNIVITPHVAEMARLTGMAAKKNKSLEAFTDIEVIKKSPERVAELFGELYGVNVILKDAKTVVHICGGETLRLDFGCGAMAKAGSGDVLCGFIAGAAAILKGNTAAALPAAVYLHGRAGCIAAEEKGEHSTLARDIAEAAGKALMSAEGI